MSALIGLVAREAPFVRAPHGACVPGGGAA